MHSRIKELYGKVKESHSYFDGDLSLLFELRNIGATRTEAVVILHQGYEIDLDHADNIVNNSRIFPIEDLSDIAYQTWKYLVGAEEE